MGKSRLIGLIVAVLLAAKTAANPEEASEIGELIKQWWNAPTWAETHAAGKRLGDALPGLFEATTTRVSDAIRSDVDLANTFNDAFETVKNTVVPSKAPAAAPPSAAPTAAGAPPAEAELPPENWIDRAWAAQLAAMAGESPPELAVGQIYSRVDRVGVDGSGRPRDVISMWKYMNTQPDGNHRFYDVTTGKEISITPDELKSNYKFVYVDPYDYGQAGAKRRRKTRRAPKKGRSKSLRRR